MSAAFRGEGEGGGDCGAGGCPEVKMKEYVVQNVMNECGDAGSGFIRIETEKSSELKRARSSTSDEAHGNVHIIVCNGNTIEVSPSQRKYLGAVLAASPDEPEPGLNCELYCGRLPKDVLEDDLIPLFSQHGEIWDLRLLMNASSYKNRGYAFVKFTNPESARTAMAALNNHVIKPGTKGVQIEFCKPRVRLFIGNIPKAKSKDELFSEFSRRTRGLKDVIIYKAPEDKKKNRGFCFLEYDNHTNAFSAKKLLGIPFAKVWGCEIIVDWADPIEEPENEIMESVKVLYVRNLTSRVHEDTLRDLFASYGTVERVKRIKDFAFVHFDLRENAEKALRELNHTEFLGSRMEVTWAKPPVDNQRKEEVLRARERRMTEMQRLQNSQSLFLCPPIQPFVRIPAATPLYADIPFEYGEEIPYEYEYEHYYPHLHPARYSASDEFAYYGNENLNEYSVMHAAPLVIDDSYVHGRPPFHPATRPLGRPATATVMGHPPVPLTRSSLTNVGNGRYQRRQSAFAQAKDFVHSELIEHDDNWRGNSGRVLLEQPQPPNSRSAGAGAGRRSKSWRRRT